VELIGQRDRKALEQLDGAVSHTTHIGLPTDTVITTHRCAQSLPDADHPVAG
jgi:hypothetical protein